VELDIILWKWHFYLLFISRVAYAEGLTKSAVASVRAEKFAPMKELSTIASR